MGAMGADERLSRLGPRRLFGLFEKYPMRWEPVSGFEPLACRLQDGCSAY
jgi:hypothetical protein